MASQRKEAVRAKTGDARRSIREMVQRKSLKEVYV